MSDTERMQETLFDIPIFTWTEWDDIDISELQFYNVEFPFESMKKYNGCDCSLDSNGRLTITRQGKEISKDLYDTEVVWEGFVCEIPEFLEIINKRYKG